MSEPPQKGTVPPVVVNPTWNGRECGGATAPPTIRLEEKGPPHLQVATKYLIL
jgi:hypothetical protein